MTSVRGRGRIRWERSSIAPSVSPSVAPPDSSLPPESGDKLSDQLAGPSVTKPLVANAPAADTSIPKYSKDDLQRILKAVLEARAPAPTPAPTPAPASIVSKAPREKLKARSLDIYRGKSYIDCYNFYQQCKDYFAITGATGLPGFPLPRLSSGTGLASTGSSKSGGMMQTPLSRSRGTSSRHCSNKAWVTHKPL